MTVVELNRYLENKYATSRDIDTLMSYVISETLPPIEDFENAIKIIRNNYKVNINSTLLIIGSYLLSGWSSEKNEMLNTLNEMYLFLSEKEKAVTSFLNAYHIRFHDRNYKRSDKYKMYLTESVKINTPFVFNRVWLSEIVSPKLSKVLKAEAINNIEKVYSLADIKKTSVTDWISPDYFINEKILGTHISYAVKETIMSEF